uniref:Uncharacterized protein n=1 Tax=viral metagenome TaxID=1070528 RepID=A0A6C0ERT9_9ZZZZ
MTDSIIDGTQINTGVISYSSPKAHASGGKVVNVYNKNSRESLTIATPLILTWGAQEGKDTAGNPTGKYTMSLQFPNSDYPNADCEAFLQSMRNVESKIKADAMTYSKDWFGKVITSTEVMDEKFNIMLRHPKIKGSQEADLGKAPTLTVKIPCWSKVWKSEIYDEEGEPLFVSGKINSHLSPLEFIKPKTHVICLIQCGGLWFINGKVSITWNLKQAIVQKPKVSMEGQCFLRPKNEDKQKLKSLPPPEDDVDPDGAVGAFVEDSDDEVESVPVVLQPKVAPVVSVPVPVQEVVLQAAEPVQVSEAAPVEEVKKKRIVSKKVASKGEN